MRKLTPEEIKNYHRDGFVVVPGVFPVEECESINAEIDRIIEEECRESGEEPTQARWVMSLGLKSDLTKEIVRDDRILALVEDLVKPGISVYSAKLAPKAPHDESICHLHQDDAYYSSHQDSECRMSIWLGLQDSDAQNGGVHFIPGSHKWGLRESEWAEGGHCRKRIVDPEPEIVEKAVCPSVEAGSIVLFHGLTWHFSGPNQSDRLRRSFIVSYQEGSCKKGNGDQFEILREAI